MGAGSDIARATTRRLVAGGARSVLLAARRPHELEHHARELRRLGARTVELLTFDGDDTETHDAFADDAFTRAGDIDLVLVAFGVLGDPDHDPEHRAAAVAVAHTDYVGALSAILACSRRMEAQGRGTIVVLSSLAAERARRSNLVYGSAKAGLDAFCQGLGDRLRPRGVRVMVVRPAFVHSRMTAGRRATPLATTPDAVAAAILGGLRRDADTVWVPPITRALMSVLRHLPRAAWRRLDL
ncbi:MAG: SDR family NAD(P)-dependent oxidoreductase [Gaiellales bacterium]